MKRLDIGSGTAKRGGYITVDKDPIVGADVTHDLEVYPWPFEDDSVDEIRAYHIIEHINTENKVKLFAEMWRVLKDGGVIDIEVPKFPEATAVQDPTHVSYWVPASFWYFEKGNAYYDAFKKRYSVCKVPCFETYELRGTEGQCFGIKLKKAHENE